MQIIKKFYLIHSDLDWYVEYSTNQHKQTLKIINLFFLNKESQIFKSTYLINV